jgi:hypothetical protein
MENQQYLKEIFALAQAVIQKRSAQKDNIPMANCGVTLTG